MRGKDAHAQGRVCCAVVAALTVVMLFGAVPAGARTGEAVGTAPDPAMLEPGRYFPGPDRKSAANPDQPLFTRAVAEYQRIHGATEAQARAAMIEQGKSAGVEEELRASLGEGFGALSFDNDARRWNVALTASGSEAQARAILAAHDITTAEFVRADQSAAALDRAMSTLNRHFAGWMRAGQVQLVRQADGIRVEASPALAAADVATMRATASGTKVGARVVRTALRRPVPVVCNYYCDPPLVAGAAYTNLTYSCTTAFNVRNSVGTAYMLTAGHCIVPSAGIHTCNSTITWCGVVGADVGGYFSGGGTADGGVMEIASSWGPYPGWYAAAWSSTPAAVHGVENATVGLTLCKNGQTTGTTCGTVAGFNANGLIMVSSMCANSGDSGGGAVDPNNLYAVGIMSAVTVLGSCGAGQYAYLEPVTRAVPTLGLTAVMTVP
jgi:hypothetical protein